VAYLLQGGRASLVVFVLVLVVVLVVVLGLRCICRNGKSVSSHCG